MDASFELCRADKVVRRKISKLLPQSTIEQAFKNKDILINGKKAKPSDKISENDKITFSDFFIKITTNFIQNQNYNNSQENFKKLIVFEDENFIIINKPAGLSVQLGTNTKNAVDVMAKLYNADARLVHRIDKDTSGIVILAKNLVTTRYMLNQFKNKKIKKKYYAIVSDKNLKTFGEINVPILKISDSVIVDKHNGKNAITKYKIINNLDNDLSLIEAIPVTGRTHQIRVHMKYIGCPILGDKKYGGRVYKYMCLHAREVNFYDLNNKQINIICDLPKYFTDIM